MDYKKFGEYISADDNNEIFHYTHAMFTYHDENYNLITTGGHLLSATCIIHSRN